MKTRRTLAAGAAAVAVAALAALLAAGAAPAAADTCPTTNAPNEFVVNGGSGQVGQLGKQFGTSLSVKLANTNGCSLTGNLAGYDVEFDAPNGGPSGTFAGSGSTSVIVGTDASGVATAPAFTANDTAGAYTVDVHTDLGTVELYLVNTAAGVPAAIAAVGATSEQASLDGAYPQPLQARVTDANGNPVQGAAVTFAIASGPTGASATFVGGGPASATTDADGIATSPPLVANGTPGAFTASAATSGVAAVAGYGLDNHAAALELAAVATGDPSATVATRYAQPLRARVLDAAGRPLEGASVTFSLTTAADGAGAAFLAGGTTATALTDASGQAVSPALVAGKTAGSFTATASVAGAAAPVAYTLTNRAGVPASVAAGAASGETATVGTRFDVPLAVTVTDRYGNPVAGASVVFSAPARGASGRFAAPAKARTRDGGKARAAGARTSRTARAVADAHGVAVAPPLAANRVVGGFAVTATATLRGTSKRVAFALVNLPRR